MPHPFPNLDVLPALQRLIRLAESLPPLQELLTEDRAKQYIIQNQPLGFSYATAHLTDEVIDVLQTLSEQAQTSEKFQRLLAGEPENIGENRAVMHHRLREPGETPFFLEWQRVQRFVNAVRNKDFLSSTGKPFESVVQIGIGGSGAGPKALHLALQHAPESLPGLNVHFLENIDPDAAQSILGAINMETTLFIVVSKSGETAETAGNLRLIREAAKQAKIPDFRLHNVAVTCPESKFDDKDMFRDVFYMQESIGGRYSVTAAVGTLVLALAHGTSAIQAVLQGAHQLDNAAKNENCRANMALMAALIHVWERNVLGYDARGLVPYAHALRGFPEHIKQLDCESNGKSVNRYGEPISYKTAGMLFSGIGTNSQHAYFQLLHQGSSTYPIQFIAFGKAQHPPIAISEPNHQQLTANAAAQMMALARGREDAEARKQFDGGRPSTLVFGKQLTAATLGALLAFYENKVMFEGFLWNINSFDQEGVQLGKDLANAALVDQTSNPLLNALSPHIT